MNSIDPTGNASAMAPSPPLSCVGAVVWKEDKVLLVRRGHPPNAGTWTLPGGRQEFGETVRAAILREVREETGLEVTLLGLVDVVDLTGSGSESGGGFHYTVVEWAAEWTGGEPRAGGDAAEVAWCAVADLKAYAVTDDVLKVIGNSRALRRGLPSRVRAALAPVQIRDFADADKQALISLARELQATELPLLSDRLRPPDQIGEAYVEALIEACRRHKGHILVATVDGEVAGYAVVLTEVAVVNDPEELPHSYADLKDLAVKTEHRRQGIGAHLVARCEHIAREAGAPWLRVTVLSGNRPALNIYDRAGFTPLVGVLEKRLRD